MPLTEEERKERQREASKKFRANNRDKLREARRMYYLKNKEASHKNSKKWAASNKTRTKEINKKCKERPKSVELRKKWETSNRDLTQEYSKKSYRKRSTELSDAYVREVLRAGLNFKTKDIPQCLVDLKRQQIILLRTIKEIQKCKT